MPQENLNRLLYMISATGVIIQYLSLSLSRNYPWSPMENLQMFMQTYYIYLYLQHFKVKNIITYIDVAISRGSYMYFLLYIYCIVSFFTNRHILMALASNFIFVLHWNEHSIILYRVNQMLIKN